MIKSPLLDFFDHLHEHPGEAHELDEVVVSDGRDNCEQIAIKFQDYWRSNSGYADRWKPAQVE